MSKFPYFSLSLAVLTVLPSPGCVRSLREPRKGPGRGVAPVQTAPVAAFRATNYEIRASLDTFGQVMNAQAKVDFAAK